MLRHLLGVAARTPRYESLIRHLAELCTPAVAQLVAERVAGMGVCETRGYIRARAGGEVRRRVRASAGPAWSAEPGLEATLIARVTERVVSLVMRRLATASWSTRAVQPAVVRSLPAATPARKAA